MITISREAMTALQELVELEKRSTQGEWRVREHARNPSMFFVERPREAGEAYGVEILGEDYPPALADRRRGDADFIAKAKEFARLVQLAQ